MRRALVATILAVTACGPQTEVPTDGGSTSSSDDQSSSGEPTTTATTGAASTGEPTTATEASTAGSSDDTAGDLLVPSDWVITSVSCMDDGTVSFLIEAFLVPRQVEDCAPFPAAGIDGLLLIGMSGWDGMGGTFEVGMGQPALASYGLEEATGTITLEVSEPTYPSFITIHLTSGAMSFQGDLDLAPCLWHYEGTCEPTGG